MAARSGAIRSLAIFNQAGGTGKSTVALHLADALARRGRKVLLIDADPQSSLTLFCGLDPRGIPPEKSTAAALVPEGGLHPQQTAFGFSLVPGGMALAEAELGGEADPEAFAAALEKVSAAFDVTIIDCPPTLGLLSVTVLSAVDGLIAPVETQYKAFRGAELLLDTLGRVRTQRNPRLRLMAVLPTRYDSRNGQDRQILASIQAGIAQWAPIWEPIPRATAYPDASLAGKPLSTHDPKHPHLLIWDRLAMALEAGLRG